MSGVVHHRLRDGEEATLRAAYRFLYHSGFLALAFLIVLLLCVFLLDKAAF